MKETFSNPEQTVIPLVCLGFFVFFCEKDPQMCNKHTQKELENHLCKLPELVKKYAQISASN